MHERRVSGGLTFIEEIRMDRKLNQRKKKKKVIYESDCKEIWGYVMSYKELKMLERMYHEYIIINHHYRSGDNSDEELSYILGITSEGSKEKFIYPNRFRHKTLRRFEGNGFHKVL